MATTQRTEQRQQNQPPPPADNTPARLDPKRPIGNGTNLSALLKSRADALVRVIPRTSGLTPERIAQVAAMAVSRDPWLMKCTGLSLIVAVTKAAELGLDVSGTLGSAYLIPFTTKGVTEAQLVIGYKGLVALAFRSGRVASVEARAVFAGDVFDYQLGTSPRIVHRPAIDRPPGELRLVYAVARLTTGGVMFEVMNRAEVDAIRAQSKAGERGPWVTHYPEMAKKTVVRRLCKLLPLSIDARQAIADDDEREFGDPAGPGRPAAADVNAMLGRGAVPASGDDVTDPRDGDDGLGPDTGDGDGDVVDGETVPPAAGN